MSMDSVGFVGFADGASHHTQNIASAAWVIYSPPIGQLAFLGGACLGPVTTKYSTLAQSPH
jgi:hypothetical protein